VARQRDVLEPTGCVQEARHDIGEVPAEQWGLEPYRNRVGPPPARFGRAGDGGFADRAFLEHLPIQTPRLTAPDIVQCAAGWGLLLVPLSSPAKHASPFSQMQGESVWSMWQVSCASIFNSHCMLSCASATQLFRCSIHCRTTWRMFRPTF
jgi:hypothetical protein